MFKKEKKKKEPEVLPDYGAGQKTRNIVDTIVFWVTLALLAALAFMAVQLFAPKGGLVMSIVEGDSMLDTLHDGQVTFCYYGEYERGDIVVAFVDKAGEEILVVKRLIGLPGDEILIDPTGVYVNGQRQQESYLSEENVLATYEEHMFNSVTLADDEYFLLGDNRKISYDSRWFGPVKEEKMGSIQSTTPVLQTWLCLVGIIVIGVVVGILQSNFDEWLIKIICTAIAKKRAAKSQ